MPPYQDYITIPADIMPKLNDFEKSFIGQCHHLQYRTIKNRMVLEPFIRDEHRKKIVYADLVVCECAPILMWVQDGSRKTVYRMCAQHGLVFNGHLERARKPTECHDVKRSGNSRRGWSAQRG